MSSLPFTPSHWKIEATQKALQQSLLHEEQPVNVLYNLSYFKRLLGEAKSAFGENFLHTMAVKANPVMSFMKEVKQFGFGVETASLGELKIALEAGFDPKKIVFDSPAKSISELKLALEKGTYLNIDNFQEFERIKKLVETGNYANKNIGIRINPQIGGGAIEALSTATSTSKFGIPTEYLPQLYEVYQKHEWLNGIHVHVGSQGCPLSLMAEGIRKTMDIVLRINQTRPNQIKFVDIGGGLPVNFESEEDVPTFKEYADLLRKTVPELFDGRFTVMTEFGRAYNAKVAVTAARVEYTKITGGRGIAVIQAGADFFVRTIYLPEKWPLRVTVLDSKGNPKTNPVDEHVWDIAGPCCFSGDVVAWRRTLPPISPGDIILVHDTGAYYYSSFSHYNSRQAPPVYAIENGVDALRLMKKGETVEDTIRFFS